MKRTAVAAILVAATILAAGPLFGGGVKFSGKNLDDLDISFDPGGFDLSTPEGAARSLLSFKVSVTGSKSFMIKLARIEHEARRDLLGPLLTKVAYQQHFAKRAEQIERAERMKAPERQLVLDGQTKLDDGSLALVWTIKTAGKRTSERSRVVVVKEGEGWKVRSLERICFSCDGGSCRCQTRKAPARQCYACNGTGKCRVCRATGWRPDSFLRGPVLHENLPPLQGEKLDQRTPQGTFSAFDAAVRNLRIKKSLMSNRFRKGFDEFARFFVARGARVEPRKVAFSWASFEVVETDKKEGGATITYRRGAPGEVPAPKSSAGRYRPRPYRMELVRQPDGKWRISAILDTCWRCGGKGTMTVYGKEKKETPCTRCEGKGFKATPGYFPTD